VNHTHYRTSNKSQDSNTDEPYTDSKFKKAQCEQNSMSTLLAIIRSTVRHLCSKCISTDEKRGHPKV